MTVLRSLFVILIISHTLLACGSGATRVPIQDFQPPPSKRVGSHLVVKGETLYSIAWRYNLDYKALAAANGIGSDFLIHPGQRLVLDVKSKASTKVATVDPSISASSPPIKPPVNRTKVRSKNKSSPETKKTPSIFFPDRITWQWPSDGQILTRFNSANGQNKGIDLAGKLGEPVRAASAGKVVYSGSKLRGYGKLLIIKHSEKYLSAYAHNRRLLVKEGDFVEAGQKIAEMGSSGANRVKLHFEIRYDGKPVDPLKYLSPRKTTKNK